MAACSKNIQHTVKREKGKNTHTVRTHTAAIQTMNKNHLPSLQ